MNRNDGLTLIEMLVALSILAVLSVLSYRVVADMTETSRHLDASSRDFARLGRSLDAIERDLAFARDLPGDLALKGNSGEIRFVRAGSNAIQGHDAAPASIGYRFRENKLERLRYPDPTMLSTAAEAETLLSGQIKELQFRFRDTAGGWQPTWPPPDGATLPPRAVEYRVKLVSGDELLRVVALP